MKYTDFLGVIVNSKLRNAIGHNDVEYVQHRSLLHIFRIQKIEQRKRQSIYWNLKVK